MENGFVKFNNKNWGYAGDKQTWAKVDDGKLPCGGRVTVDLNN